jgi:phage tail protein X
MLTYRTKDGDTLDWICHKHYGRTSGAVEAVLEANPSLASKGPIYTAGVSIKLPELPEAQAETVVRLWD